MDNKLISIICITYNHEKYIEKAINSFLMQKGNIIFEIIIHDDASTDKTSEIVKKFERKHPKIIKGIYQSENQYSKGKKVFLEALKYASGKYIANCEGDDYWTDPYKLQKQITYMESHNDCSMCVHSAITINENGKKCLRKIQPSNNDRDYYVEEIIKKGGGLFSTNSFFERRSISMNKPLFYYTSPVGDYPTMIHSSLNGYVHYMSDNMSAYRIGVSGGWSEKIKNDTEKRSKHAKALIDMLDEVNEITNNKFNDTIQFKKKEIEFKLIIDLKKFNLIKNKENINFYKNLKFKIRVKLFIQQYLPKFEKSYYFIKRVFNG